MIQISVDRRSHAKTRTHILNVAERLFADHGLEVVSVRDITTKAKASLGAINYHFGTKLGLIAAIFDRRLTPVTQGRLAALDVVEKKAGSNNPSVEDILRAFICPAFSGNDHDHTFRKLMGRCLSEPSQAVEKMLHEQFGVVAQRFDAALLRVLPKLTPQEIFWRMSLIIAGLHHSLLVVSGAFPSSPDVDLDEKNIIERLVFYGASLLRAPPFSRTRLGRAP